MTEFHCYEDMPGEVIRELALRRAAEVEFHDDDLFYRLLTLSHTAGWDDPDSYLVTDYDALDARPDIPRRPTVSTGVVVRMGPVAYAVGRQA